MSVDPYSVLQVAPFAEPDVVRAAYRALARKHHPDTGGDERSMAVLNAAWDILGHRERRAAYDAERKRRAAIRETAVAMDITPRTQTTSARAPTSMSASTPASTPSPSPRPAPRAGADTVLDFGRYAGRSLRDLGTEDPDYLEWLGRTSIGRAYRREIDALLARRATATAAAGRQAPARR